MGFNNGLERVRLENRWKKLRVQYRAAGMTRKQYEDAGMSREAIQAMYDYDWSVFNANRSYQNHTQEMAAPSFEQSEESYSPLMDKYQKAISVTDHYCETKSCFTWIGEIENERVLAALENLSELDLKILTLYVYAGYTESEIAMTLESKRITIHKRIERMTHFLFQVTIWPFSMPTK